MFHAFLVCRSAKQAMAFALWLPGMGPSWSPPPPPPQYSQTHPSSWETWAILHHADEAPRLRVTQAELQSTAAWPSYQMTWNPAPSPALTAGSLTEAAAPARLLDLSQRWSWGPCVHPPSWGCCSHPPGCCGLKLSHVLAILHGDSFLSTFIFHLDH